MSSWENIKNTLGALAGVALLVGVMFLAGKTLYELDRDLDSLMDRAAVAGDATDMRLYLDQLATNMRIYDAMSGHAAYIFKNPRNDLAAQYQGIQRSIERLRDLESLPTTDPSYQQGLDDLRGIVREMPRLNFGVFLVRGPWLMCRQLGGCEARGAAVSGPEEASRDGSESGTVPEQPSVIRLGPTFVNLGMRADEIRAAIENDIDYRVSRTTPESFAVARRRGPSDWVPVGSFRVRDGVITQMTSILAETSTPAVKMAIWLESAATMMFGREANRSCQFGSRHRENADGETTTMTLTCGRHVLNVLHGWSNEGQSASMSLTAQ